jgi:hypothetical protein
MIASYQPPDKSDGCDNDGSELAEKPLLMVEKLLMRNASPIARRPFKF